MLVFALRVKTRVLLRNVRKRAFALAVVLGASRLPLACALEELRAQKLLVFWVPVLGLIIVVHQFLQLHIALRVV